MFYPVSVSASRCEATAQDSPSESGQKLDCPCEMWPLMAHLEYEALAQNGLVQSGKRSLAGECTECLRYRACHSASHLGGARERSGCR